MIINIGNNYPYHIITDKSFTKFNVSHNITHHLKCSIGIEFGGGRPFDASDAPDSTQKHLPLYGFWLALSREV